MLPSSSLTTLPATFPDMDALLLVLELLGGGALQQHWVILGA
jgi:hypothetical protein